MLQAASGSNSPLFDAPRAKRGPDKKPRRMRHDRDVLPSLLGKYFAGGERSHSLKWLAAMRAGRAALPTCEAITSEGTKCRFHRMKHSQFCCKHLKGKARDAVDDIAYKECLSILARKTAPTIRARAMARMASIDKRRLHRAWQKDPTLHGSTLSLSAGDETSVRRWLRSHNVDLDDASKEWTPRFIDRVRWASFMHLTERFDEARAWKRVDQALREEARWKSRASQT